MSIEVVLEGKLAEEKDFEGYVGFIRELAEKWQLKMEIYEDEALIEVCPEGLIEVAYEKPYITISTQTNVAGPGFHAYVCDFYHAIQKASPIPVNVSDPTGYYTKQDFTHLTNDIFYRWLHDIADFIKKNEQEYESLCICWPMEYYEPKHKKGYVVTPMGYIAMHDFYHMRIDELADRFFVWNHKGRDGEYYRNAALNLLWKECYFAYSNMNEATQNQADTILDLLEIAHRLKPELALPMKEYEALCEIRGREKLISHGIPMESEEIGYRKQIVELHFGNWSIPVDGCAEKSVDDSSQTLYLMAPYKEAYEPWKWMYKVNIYAFKQRVETMLEDIEKAKRVYDISHDDMVGKVALETQEDHLVLRGQLNCEKEMMLIEIIICDEQSVEALLELVKQIKYREMKNDEVQA